MEWPFGVCFGPRGGILECVLEWNKVRFFVANLFKNVNRGNMVCSEF